MNSKTDLCRNSVLFSDCSAVPAADWFPSSRRSRQRGCFWTLTHRDGRVVLSLLAFAVLMITNATVKAQTDRATSLAQRRFETFRERRSELLLNLRHEIAELSRECHETGLTDAARDLTQLSLDLTADNPDAELSKFVQLPVSNRLPAEEQRWRQRLKVLREDRAKELYVLARRCLQAKFPSLAYSMVHDVLRLDPDHRHSRSILGQQLFQDAARQDDPTYAGEWVTAFEASKRSGRDPEVNHPEFGWIPVSHVRRYEEGERPLRGRWISAEKESELRRDFANGWEIRTEHFLVQTNTSREEGVEISRKLETFYSWLTANMPAFFDTPQALEKKFEQAQGRSSRVMTRPMKVHYFATRDEYNRTLRGKIPANQVTNGLYWEPDLTSYFFRNPEDPDHRTVFHEATHQILDVTTRSHRVTASRRLRQLTGARQTEFWHLCQHSNFWIIEGLACYFESFEITDGVVSVGRPDYIRFAGARQRCLQDGFFVPFRGFMALGHEPFMRHPNVAQFYTQASGVAHFLMHYNDGVYRDDLVALLSAVYRPDLKNLTKQPSLQEISGVPFVTMDQQYRIHLGNL